MILGIDASNLRSGGAITHLSELLREADPSNYGFTKIILWGEASMLSKIEDRPWLVKVHEPLLDKSLPHRLFWQKFKVSKLARNANCNMIFIPSGIILGDFKPVVTMSHNLLPFQWGEIKRYGPSWQMLRNVLLNLIQSFSFKKADGMIFLSNFAQKTIMNRIKKLTGSVTIIPHGVHKVFSFPPGQVLPIKDYSNENPFRIIYISTIDMYKHQWNVAEAIAGLRSLGYPIELELIGSAYPKALAKLEEVTGRVDPQRTFIKYLGSIDHSKLPEHYAKSHLCLFASSCENMPNILLEGMSSGLSIACSDRGPMKEVLGDAGLYFDPTNPRNIADCVRTLIDSPELRAKNASASFNRVQSYSWKTCAQDTFKFFQKVGLK
ncbi:MAG TPA: glycosyltransferase family 1 protein [Bacteriovoracaceae bacterium]|nr:glycosyltransferase family 1 protein [Bacteriovoracaceae bacterium]